MSEPSTSQDNTDFRGARGARRQDETVVLTAADVAALSRPPAGGVDAAAATGAPRAAGTTSAGLHRPQLDEAPLGPVATATEERDLRRILFAVGVMFLLLVFAYLVTSWLG